MTVLAVMTFLEMLLYMKKRCLIKAVCFSLLGAVLGYVLLVNLGLTPPLTEGSAVLYAILGLPGILLISLGQLILPLL